MRQRWALAITLALLMLGPESLHVAAAADTAQSTITVVLCDLAGLNAVDRTEARGQASRILASANVSVEWIESCNGIRRATFYSLLITAKRPADWDSSSYSMGKAVVLNGPYPRAYVFMNLVKAFDSSTSSKNQAILLGHAMAHELGHLLGQPHALSGIMTADWGFREKKEALAGALLFAHRTPVSR